MSNQNNGENKSSRGLLNIIVGIFLGIVLVVGYFKVNEFLKERKIETNTQVYNANEQNTELTSGEPTDLPPYQKDNNMSNNEGVVTSNNDTWNGNDLIGIESARSIAIETVDGGEIIKEEKDIYDLDDEPTYDFKIKNGTKVYEVEIYALTGKVKHFELD